MKYVQVTVTKSIANGGYKFIYPAGYDAKKIMIEAYEHQADPTKNGTTEFCYGKASNDFPENVDIVVLPQAEYDAAVSAIKNPV